MATLKERLFTVLQDPRVAKLMRDPNVQKVAIKAFRFRGRIEGAVDQRVQRIAGMLNLATQRDLRALQRRIRHLERELREADERLTDAEDAREAPARS
ncbi:MAG: phasin family protein [Deltaproteobacteria bacterium]|jgi:polyhydroxyalkanoate synthesis regulator phasin|nr:phasin family protein [Deltaproteobacteria bacterium]MBW1874456.1 phasin family protein [Deltaproteobacteria bacterium]MBW2209904.1 phasin family protein [Deltaproteobacteria bacterium]MBW2213048.1 phasin family protein [Deltaproteobacteria bacterium]MBW2378222.1 phasin family protein [Deltaproteobacteria bacterium]